MKRPTTWQFFKSSVSYALLLISLSPLFPQSPTRDDVESWWRRGSKYMRGQGEEFKDRTPAERRKLAEPWLLSAWQNRKQLTPFTKKQVGVRLLQARIANTNYLEAQETLAEIEADPDFGPCKLDPKDLPLDRITLVRSIAASPPPFNMTGTHRRISVLRTHAEITAPRCFMRCLTGPVASTLR